MEPQVSFSVPVDNAVAQTGPVCADIMPNTEFSPEVPVAANEVMDISKISILADSISISSQNQAGCTLFDIVLTLSWTEGDEWKTAKVVKTIAFDKLKMFEQACSGMPITVVEDKERKNKVAKQKTLLKTMRELGGIAGKGTFV